MAGIGSKIQANIKNLKPFPLHLRRALLLAFAAMPMPASALGLGELTVSSSLGQALNAEIALLGNPAELNADCFKIAPHQADTSALPNDLQLTLEHSGNRPRLRLKTRQAVNEPALMLTVAALCPERIQREYALLLDPPGIGGEPPVVATPAPDTAPRPVAAAKTPEAPARAQPAVPSALAARAVAPAPAFRPTGLARRTASAPASRGARLVLSGNRLPYALASANLALNMDVGLLDTSRRAEAPFTPEQITDENTALNRKVAHLEELLATLQQQNKLLEQARAKVAQARLKTAAPAEKPSAPQSNWLYFILGVGLLTGGTAYALFRRRQHDAARQNVESDLWRVPPPTASAPAQAGGEVPAPVLKQPKAEATDEPEIRPLAPLPASSDEGTEVKDSVADEVEVFVAHGHSDLAIHMLEDHIEKAPEESPVPWLLLLDLLRREGAESKYENYRQKCKLYFNVAMPAYGEIEINLNEQGIETFAHITSELVRLWPTDQVNAYLDDLIFDRRGGSRVGFDPATYRDIVLLRAIRAGDVWKSII
jgi:hypothetical protein